MLLLNRFTKPVFTGGFSQCIKSDLDGDFPADRKPFNDFYTYNDDSDFEDDQDVDLSGLHRAPGTPITVDTHLKEDSETSSTLVQELEDTKSDPIGESEPTSQVISYDSRAQRFVLINTLRIKASRRIQRHLLGDRDLSSSSRMWHSKRRLSVVLSVLCCSMIFTNHQRLRALIFYLSTGDITFSPLRSAQTRNSSMPIRHIYEPVPCSAKSIYRLACEVLLSKIRVLPYRLTLTISSQLQLEDLKTRAQTHIRDTLTPENALDEFFSEFTSWYAFLF